MATIGVCITTLNEAATIGSLVRRFASQPNMKVFVVDDGSSDHTVSEAVLAGATAVWQTQERLGIGPCLMRAWEMALDANVDVILQIDAGGSHDPADAECLLESVKLVDMAIGSRFTLNAAYINGTWKRRVLSRLAAIMMNYAQSGAHWTDWTSGYRAFRASTIRGLLSRPYFAKMHGWQIQVLAYAGEMGYSIVECPIRYTAGRSSFNRKVAWEAFQAWTDVLHHVGWIGSRLHIG